MSPDSPDSHRRFIQRNQLPFSLLSDTDGKVASDYRVKRRWLGNQRVTYLIGQNRSILKVFHHELDIPRHIKDVQDALNDLSLQR